MIVSEFLLEKYFAQYEFTADYMFSCSDCDGYSMKYILEQATDQEREMWENLHLGYTETPGSPFLRKAIAEYYRMAEEEDIVVASPGELSFMTMNILMEGIRNRHAVVVSPAYQSLYQVLKSLGCELSYWAAEEEEDGWKFDIAKLRALVRPDTRLIVINFPHNPTGAYLTREELEEVVAIARECGAYIYSDEMYRDLLVRCPLGNGDMTAAESGGSAGKVYEPLPPVCDIYERGISLWGMAKSFGLAGARIGWIASQDKWLTEQLLTYKPYLSMCSSAPSEILSAIVLNHPEAFLSPNIEKIQRNVALFRESIAAGKLPWVEKFIPPVAGSVAFVKIKCDGTAMEWSEALVQSRSILTVPAEMFEYPGTYLRIGFGRENFPEVLKMMEGVRD